MKISVIIPCYNEEEFIGQAIGSIIEQSLSVDEIIVVDDGSSDDSASIAESFGEPVTVLSNRGKGAQQARNFGADYSSGDALMFFDADDVLGPDALENLASYLVKNPGGIAACPWFRLEKAGEKWVSRRRSCPPLAAEKDYLSGWMRGIYHPPCSVLWSRAAYERTGGWDTRVSVNQDGDLMMRALADGVELHITDSGSAYYRRLPEDQLSASQSAGQFTRSGRESQIFVLQKVARRLEERGVLNRYRKPLTDALDHTRDLCRDEYPELADECAALIKKYGEPGHIHTARKLMGIFQQGVHLGMNKAAGSLNELGLTKTRRFLGSVKNKLMPAGGQDKKQSYKSYGHEHDVEILYGLTAYKKAISNEGNGKVSK